MAPIDLRDWARGVEDSRIPALPSPPPHRGDGPGGGCRVQGVEGLGDGDVGDAGHRGRGDPRSHRGDLYP